MSRSYINRKVELFDKNDTTLTTLSLNNTSLFVFAFC
jgi:hypothetical protein